MDSNKPKIPNDTNSSLKITLNGTEILPEFQNPMQWTTYCSPPLEAILDWLAWEERKMNYADNHFMKLVCNLVKAVELFKNCKIKESHSELNSCWGMLEDPKVPPFHMLHRAKVGLEQILFAAKASLYYKENKLKKLSELSENLVCFNNWDSSSKAMFYGCKSFFLLQYKNKYYLNDIKECIHKAIEIEPDESLWHLLAIITYRKFESHSNSIILENDVSTHIRFIKSCSNPYHIMITAEILEEVIRYKKQFTDEVSLASHNDTFLMCRKASRMMPDCLYIQLRYLIRRIYRSFKSAPSDLENSVKTLLHHHSDNADVYYIAGLLQEICLHNADEALKFYQKALKLGHYKACLSAVKLHLHENNKPCILSDLVECLNSSEKYAVELLCQIGSYMYYEEKNFLQAFKAWCEAVRKCIYAHNPAIKFHRTPFLLSDSPSECVNIILLMKKSISERYDNETEFAHVKGEMKSICKLYDSQGNAFINSRKTNQNTESPQSNTGNKKIKEKRPRKNKERKPDRMLKECCNIYDDIDDFSL